MADTYPATLSTPRSNTTTTSDYTAEAREIDFVTRFSRNWESLREILNVMRPIRKTPGTKLVSYKAEITLEDGSVAEGAVIPYSKASLEAVAHDELEIKKYAKAVTLESVDKFGAAHAVEKTDEAFLYELQATVLDGFFEFLKTGELTNTEDDFQMGMAVAIGSVVDKFKKLRRDASDVVVFVNTMDAYRYLGAAQITVQNGFGLQYINNFMGAKTVILSSDIEEGTIIATPSDNIVMYYVDPADSDFAKLGLNYTTDGDTNLIGFHVLGNYSTAVGESYAIMGIKLWAEYLDAVAVVTVSGG